MLFARHKESKLSLITSTGQQMHPNIHAFVLYIYKLILNNSLNFVSLVYNNLFSLSLKVINTNFIKNMLTALKIFDK